MAGRIYWKGEGLCVPCCGAYADGEASNGMGSGSGGTASQARLFTILKESRGLSMCERAIYISGRK